LKIVPVVGLVLVMIVGCSTNNVVLVSLGEVKLAMADGKAASSRTVRSTREEVTELSWDNIKLEIRLSNRHSINHPEYNKVRPLQLTVAISAGSPGSSLSEISGEITLENGSRVEPATKEILQSICAPNFEPESGRAITMSESAPVAVDTPSRRQAWLETHKDWRNRYDPTILTCLSFRYDVPLLPDKPFSLFVGKLSRSDGKPPIDLRVDFSPTIYRPSTH